MPAPIPGLDYIGVAVSFFCHDGKGRFVMAKRGPGARNEIGRWDTGAGGVKFGETVLEALKREIKEEYGADILDFQFLGFHEIRQPQKQSGRPSHWITLDFKVLVDPQEVKNMEPEKMIAELGWFTLDKLPQPLHSIIPAYLKKYQAQLKK